MQANPRQLGIVDQGLTPFWLHDLFGAREQCVEISVFVDELCCGLHSDAWNAGHVVRRIAGQCLHLHHLLGRYAELLHHLVGPDLAHTDRIHHDHAVAD